jgi:hypothetical protein
MYIFIAAILGTILGLKRRCPQCGREPIVPRDKKRKSVSCKFCGEVMPPAPHRSGWGK